MEEVKGGRNDGVVGIEDVEQLEILDIVNSIEPQLQALGFSSVTGEQPCTIYRVPKLLRQVNEKCYEPQLVSIGPYHRGKEGLKAMEEKKFEHLRAILFTNPKLTLEDYVKEIKKLEADARSCYSESISLSPKEFVEMMVLDGCFLVEIFLRIGTSQISQIGNEQWLLHFLTHDMLLLENQLPFFIVQRIVALVVPNQEADLLKDFILDCFGFINVMPLNEDAAKKESYHHVLDMFHHHCLPTHCAGGGIKLQSDPDPNADRDIEAQYNAKQDPDMIEGRSHAAITEQLPYEIPSAEELDYAGITFQRKEKMPGSFLDIEFDDKEGAVLKIPYVYFSDDLHFIFRNLIAYEQCYRKSGTFFTGYAMFMDDLINTAKDVRVLRRAGILHRGLGSDEELARLFNQLSKGVFHHAIDTHLYRVRKSIYDCCRMRWIRWRAQLMREYFSSGPALSTSIGLLGLYLAIAQTVIAIKSAFS